MTKTGIMIVKNEDIMQKEIENIPVCMGIVEIVATNSVEDTIMKVELFELKYY